MQHYGVGGGPLDEEPVHGEWRGVGPVTQVAVFERAGAWAAGVSEVGAPLHEHGQAVVWSSGEVVGLNAAAGVE